MIGTGSQFDDWYRKYFTDPDGRQPFFIDEPYPDYVRPRISRSAKVFSAAGTLTWFHLILRSDVAAGYASMLRTSQHMSLSFRPFSLPYFSFHISSTDAFQFLCTSFRFASHIQ